MICERCKRSVVLGEEVWFARIDPRDHGMDCRVIIGKGILTSYRTSLDGGRIFHEYQVNGDRLSRVFFSEADAEVERKRLEKGFS